MAAAIPTAVRVNAEACGGCALEARALFKRRRALGLGASVTVNAETVTLNAQRRNCQFLPTSQRLTQYCFSVTVRIEEDDRMDGVVCHTPVQGVKDFDASRRNNWNSRNASESSPLGFNLTRHFNIRS